MTSNFDRAFDIIISSDYESCRLVMDKDDPGGATKFGISQRSYPNEDIQNLTRERAKEIYEADYWRKIRGDSLPFCIAFMLFDFAVNSGISRSIKCLQGCVFTKQDGAFGDMTLNALMSHPKHEIITQFTHDRIAFYESLHKDKYINGWRKRAIRTGNLCAAEVGK